MLGGEADSKVAGYTTVEESNKITLICSVFEVPRYRSGGSGTRLDE